MDRSEFDRFRHIHKDPKQDRKTDPYKLRHRHSERHTHHGTFLRTVRFPGTEILAHKGCQRHGHAHDRKKGNPLKLREGPLSGDCESSEGIDV